MTKKDYEQFADLIGSTRFDSQEEENLFISKVCVLFTRDNELFSTQKFVDRLFGSRNLDKEVFWRFFINHLGEVKSGKMSMV